MLLAQVHREDEVAFGERRILVEQGAQVARAGEHRRNVGGRGEKRPQLKIHAPTVGVDDDRRWQTGDAVAQILRTRFDRCGKLFLVAGDEFQTRIDERDGFFDCRPRHLVGAALRVELRRPVLEPVEDAHASRHFLVARPGQAGREKPEA